ncbi:nose resistant to fluoxetine protein 6 [Culicoides brevitarsis]|uniref:nose resistant to fluoxetine protein 6 n=1 Tax=Culicoides brevitarsis TaxID=469753 RepID=UPI00307B50C3
MTIIKYLFITLTLLVMNAYLLVDKDVCANDNICLHRSLQQDIESLLFAKTENISLKQIGMLESIIEDGEGRSIANNTVKYEIKQVVNGSEHDEQRDSKIIVEDRDNKKNNNANDYNVNEEDVIKVLSARMLQVSHPFMASKAKTASNLCKIHTRKFLTYLEKMELWALKMHDSSAKISAGILNGNINQFGDFDECLSVEEPDGQFQGQYCLVYLQPDVKHPSPKLSTINKLAQSYGVFKSEFDDPGHRVPRFSTINWGVCVPSTCTHHEVEDSMKIYMRNFTANTGIEFKIRVEQEMCQVKQPQWHENLDNGTKVACGFFLFIGLFAVFASLYEHMTSAEHPNEWITAFSLIKNTKNLLSFKREPNDIACVHGIRAFNAYLLIISHKSMALLFNPYSNRTAMAEIIGQPWTVIARAASLYTDPFIMMSGLLTTYSLVGRLQRGQKIKFAQEYIGRFLRIAPPLGALILFCTYVLPLMGSGPQWNLVITHHSGICKMYWWRNLMFIHNYFGFENMCLTHTHHIGIDTQLFMTAPIFAVLLWKWPKKSLWLLVGIASISTAARYYVTFTKNLSNYVFFGTSIRQLFDTADFMYIIPAHRLTVYIIGVLLGYFMRIYKDLKLTPAQLRLGWWTSTALMLASFVGPAPMGSLNYQYSPTHAAIYAAWSPIGWCAFFAWIIFTSHLGYNDNIVTKFFSWKGFLVTTRISYAVYLTQFPIFFYNVGNTRTAEHYEFLRMTINWNEYFFIILTSYLLTVLFESPFSNLKKLIFRTKRINNKVILTENNNSSSPDSSIATITNEENIKKTC